ncbi:cytochrome P450 [Allokutzneria sp. A3M-2-11 16]|uniref:cytochrome P450 n=1 Tax=Allokutzneria sp. A3M-2-11 16 TaxID=2962043 RepID=UPI0020B82D07|nr:cytochrome P450 [Allokutzneria sp. A3M-2-11 16]MCP3798484.1 cytochrome P450 [Allokutzneria sp. A3M-2-11 16]
MNCPVAHQSMPTERVDPLMPPPGYAQLLAEAPVTKVLDLVGEQTWLVTRYADVRAVLGDTRFSSDFIPPEFKDLRREDDPLKPFIRLDPPEHTRFRRALTGEFTVRQIRLLEPGIRQLVESQLDELERAGQGADLVEHFALPIPSLVICQLLGVPYTDHSRFQHDSKQLLTRDIAPEERARAGERLRDYMLELVELKRREPDAALMTRLIERSAEMEQPFTDLELASIGMLLLVAGHETTANMIGLTTVALLRSPDKVEALRADPAKVDAYVEEALRLLTIVQHGVRRLATEDIEVGGTLIRKGEWVIASLAAGNRDPGVYADPDELDADRKRVSHLSFGFGPHQCLGQQLARVEMQIALNALFRRFPALRVDLPEGEIPYKSDMLIYGVHHLPVGW